MHRTQQRQYNTAAGRSSVSVTADNEERESFFPARGESRKQGTTPSFAATACFFDPTSMMCMSYLHFRQVTLKPRFRNRVLLSWLVLQLWSMIYSSMPRCNTCTKSQTPWLLYHCIMLQRPPCLAVAIRHCICGYAGRLPQCLQTTGGGRQAARLCRGRSHFDPALFTVAKAHFDTVHCCHSICCPHNSLLSLHMLPAAKSCVRCKLNLCKVHFAKAKQLCTAAAARITLVPDS